MFHSFFNTPMTIPTIIISEEIENSSFDGKFDLSISLSPIQSKSPRTCSDSSTGSSVDTNEYNKTFTISPQSLRFRSYSSSGDVNFSSLSLEQNKNNEKIRSVSINIPYDITAIGIDDDVFDSTTYKTNLQQDYNNIDKFVDKLRKKSIDTCLSLIRINKIDMDTFFALVKGSTKEKLYNWDKCDDILEVLYILNKY